MSALHPSLNAALPRIADAFAQAQPFRHVVIDDFLDPDLITRLLADFPNFEERYARNESGLVGGKAVRMDMPQISPAYAELDLAIQSPEFLTTISRITGVADLLYDPAYIGGGTHENVQGQNLDPHVDFNILPESGWHRRFNLIVYLNHEWEESWGGCLDLHSDPWSHEHDQIKTVLPLYNRCVVFETNEHSWHGFRAIDLPEHKRGLSRKSLAIYLYTRDRPAEETAPSHGTIYVPPGLPAALQPGAVLEHAQWLDLRLRFARLKGQLKFLYQRELRHSRDYDEVVNALHEARSSAGFPLQGFVLQRGALSGYWPDGWISSALTLAFEPTRPAQALQLRIWAPPQLPADSTLTLTVGDQQQTLALVPGEVGVLRVEQAFAAGQIYPLTLCASHSWIPASSGQADGRELVCRLMEAVLE